MNKPIKYTIVNPINLSEWSNSIASNGDHSQSRVYALNDGIAKECHHRWHCWLAGQRMVFESNLYNAVVLSNYRILHDEKRWMVIEILWPFPKWKSPPIHQKSISNINWVKMSMSKGKKSSFEDKHHTFTQFQWAFLTLESSSVVVLRQKKN